MFQDKPNNAHRTNFFSLSFSFAEKGVIGHFAAFALLLLTRDLGTVEGWSVIFPHKCALTISPCPDQICRCPLSFPFSQQVVMCIAFLSDI